MAEEVDRRPFIVDLVEAICNGCQSVRKYRIDPPFRNAKSFIDWQRGGGVTKCDCGHPTADMKLHMAAIN